MSGFGRQVVYNGSEKIKPQWVDPDDLQRWIADELCAGETLNFPCGRSYIGDVRADIDPNNEPDVVADLLEPPHEFGRFDTVYCDPPYSFYHQDKAWLDELWSHARKRLVLQTPLVTFHFPAADKHWYVVDPAAGNSGRKPRLFQVFDRCDAELSRFA